MLDIRNILVPTDFSATSEYALKLAAALANDYGARLTLLHVAVPPPMVVAGDIPMAIPAGDHTEHLQGLLHQMRAVPIGKDVEVDRKLVEGDPATEILAMADTAGVDLIVMGTHGRTGLARLLMGSAAEQVARRATVPVLLAKAAKIVSRSPRPVETRAEVLEVAGTAV